MEDIFGDIFGHGKKQQQQRQKKGSDLRLKVSLTIDDIINGCNKKLKYKRQDSCNVCSGKGGTDIRDCIPCDGKGSRVVLVNTPFGQMRQETHCPDCQGSGKQVSNKCGECHGSGCKSIDEVVEVDIPAGVSSGMQLNMRGYGNYVRDGVPGDLHIIIDEIVENYFKRDNNNIIIEKKISIIDAILGNKIDIKTPYGDIPITIEKGTEHGDKIRISGKGIPDINYGLGDLYVIFNIKIPKKISNSEKELLNNLKTSQNFNV